MAESESESSKIGLEFGLESESGLEYYKSDSKLPRKTALCSWTHGTSYDATKHNIQGLAWVIGSYKSAPGLPQCRKLTV